MVKAMASAVLLYRKQCPKCRALSALVRVVSVGSIRRSGIDMHESETLHRRFPRSRGRLALIAGPRCWVGSAAVLAVALRCAGVWAGLAVTATSLLAMSGCPDDGAAVGSCPVDRVLAAACECGGERFEPGGERMVCDGTQLLPKEQPVPEAAAMDERCNGLDDDLDGAVDDDDVCLARCTASALDEAAAALVLPDATTPTVPMDAEDVEPQLPAYSEIPAWCLAPGSAGDASAPDVLCGEVLEVGAAGLSVERLRVAPGGVVRVVEAATLAVESELLLCPNAVLQAGGESSRDGSGGDGHDLEIVADTFIHLGEVVTRGGTTLERIEPREVGDSGELHVSASRWLFAGTIDTSGPGHPDAYAEPRAGGAAGHVSIEVELESFASGAITVIGGDGGSSPGCGNGGDGGAGAPADLVLPVCCHGLSAELAGGNGGNAGAAEDPLESAEPAPLAQAMTLLALCDGEDRFTLEADAAVRRVSLVYEPQPGEDIDLEVLDADGRRVGASEGVGSRESVELPGPGSYTVVVVSASAVPSPGAYTLLLE